MNEHKKMADPPKKKEIEEQIERQRQRTPPPVNADGYIDFQVDFIQALSEKDSNSWNEEVSISANDPNNVESEEDEDYYEEGKRRPRFDKDDGDGLLFAKQVEKAV